MSFVEVKGRFISVLSECSIWHCQSYFIRCLPTQEKVFSDCSAMHVDNAHCHTADSENLFYCVTSFFPDDLCVRAQHL